MSRGINRTPLICLAASGGGHVRQILDLEPFWSEYPHFFVTEDTALGRSIAKDRDTYFVPHFALGQARLGNPLKMFWQAAKSALKSIRIIARRKPDLVISTGAGSLFFIVIFARLAGAKIVIIDSFARFDGPSAFARLAGPFAHRRYSQSQQAGANWKGAKIFDPLTELNTFPPEKSDQIFVTVGATLPFTRLVDTVIEARRQGILSGEMLVQTGHDNRSLPTLPGVTFVETLSFDDIQRFLATSRLVICHGGTGSIITALQNHCALVVMPRSFAEKEHYDDHQMEIAAAFQHRGLAEVAHDIDGLERALRRLKHRKTTAVTTDYSGLIDDLCDFVEL